MLIVMMLGVYLYLVPCLCTVVQTVRYKMHTAQACVKKKKLGICTTFLKSCLNGFDIVIKNIMNVQAIIII